MRGHPLPHFFGHRYGIFHGTSFDGNEWNYIYSSHTGVLSLVMVQVNQFYCYTDSFYHGFFQGVRFSNNGNY